MKSVDGKRALITGAASGIGRELALAFAREGALTLLVDIDGEGLDETSALVAGTGSDSRSYVADVSSRDQVDAIAGRVEMEFGGLDILVNNAGVFIWADIADTAIEDWEWILGVNLWGPILTVNAFLPGMLERRSGHIVNVASLGGLITMPTLGAYSTSKFGLVGFTETLQHEMKPLGIAVTLVCPGNTRTPITGHIRVRGYDRDKLIRMSFDRMPRMPAERAAGLILEGIKREKGMLILTPLAHILYGMKRTAPWLLRSLMTGPVLRVYERMR